MAASKMPQPKLRFAHIAALVAILLCSCVEVDPAKEQLARTLQQGDRDAWCSDEFDQNFNQQLRRISEAKSSRELDRIDAEYKSQNLGWPDGCEHARWEYEHTSSNLPLGSEYNPIHVQMDP